LIITSSAKVVSDINFSNRVDHYYQLNDSGLVYYNNLMDNPEQADPHHR